MGVCAAGMGAAMVSEAAAGGEAAKASASAPGTGTARAVAGKASASAKAAADKPADKPARPNILFALADDWGFGHAGAYGCGWVKTPAFDRVAKEGVLFAHAYTPNAKCAPSRAAILTGRNPWQLKAAANHWCYFPPEFKVYTEALEGGGYFVGCTGKGWAPGVALDAGGNKRAMTGRPFDRRTAKPPVPRISPNDYKRIERALEVWEIMGVPISRLQREHTVAPGFEFEKLALIAPRAVLYDRVNRRVDEMMRVGWLDEVRTLLDMGVARHSTAMGGHGYRQLAAHLEGLATLDEAVEETKKIIRHYVKYQLMWLRLDPGSVPIDAHDRPPEHIAEDILDQLSGRGR